MAWSVGNARNAVVPTYFTSAWAILISVNIGALIGGKTPIDDIVRMDGADRSWDHDNKPSAVTRE